MLTASDLIFSRKRPAYFDKETNLHYNYFRDCDSATGRYPQSDPIGLAGGINPYVYTNNPLSEIDPFGLMGNAPGTYGRGGPGPVSPRSGPTFPATISVGVGTIGILGIQGGALEAGIATNFKKLCGYVQECEIRGLGACFAVGPQLGIQRGAPSTGMQQSAGIAAAGGRGLGSDIQITFDPEGNLSAVKGLPSGLPAYGGGGGYIECKTTYKCFPQ